jgi:hypothetical protein
LFGVVPAFGVVEAMLPGRTDTRVCHSWFRAPSTCARRTTIDVIATVFFVSSCFGRGGGGVALFGACST